MAHFVLHKFRPSETIDAVIRLKGRHSYSHVELKLLRERFNELNGVRVPRAGDVYKIPLETLTTDDFGDVIDYSTIVPEPVPPPPEPVKPVVATGGLAVSGARRPRREPS